MTGSSGRCQLIVLPNAQEIEPAVNRHGHLQAGADTMMGIAGVRVGELRRITRERQQRREVPADRVAHRPEPLRIDLDRGTHAAQVLDGCLHIVDVLGVHRLPGTCESVVDGERHVPMPRQVRPPVLVRPARSELPGPAVDQHQGRVRTRSGRTVQIAEQCHAIVIGVLNPELDVDVVRQHSTHRDQPPHPSRSRRRVCRGRAPGHPDWNLRIAARERVKQ